MPRRKPTVQGMIQEMVRRIVRRFDPDRIILFGSRARGDATANSDVDLLVVLPVSREDKADKEVEIATLLHDILMPKDILVASPDEFEKRHDIVGTIPYAAAAEGKVLYARPV